jgi:hypothetical protein
LLFNFYLSLRCLLRPVGILFELLNHRSCIDFQFNWRFTTDLGFLDDTIF